jgi:hypothetical protein
MLNEILGHVFFAAGSDISSIRYRTRELVALLSRAVIIEGADPEEVFGLNFHLRTWSCTCRIFRTGPCSDEPRAMCEST